MSNDKRRQGGFAALGQAWLEAPFRHDILALALLAALWLGLAVIGWGSWVDPHIDDGRELQVPIELASGKVLYRDIAYAYGPAAPYLNTAVILLAGPRIEVFLVLGLLVTLSGAGLVYAAARFFASPPLAWAPAAFWLTAGSRPWFTDTVVPYSHAAVYGVLALLAAVILACRDLKQGESHMTGWISALAALAMLSKVEFAPPALLAVAVHAAGGNWRQRMLALSGPAAAAAVYAGLAAWLGFDFMFQDNFNWTPYSYFFRNFRGAMLQAAAWNTPLPDVAAGAGIWLLIWAGSALAFSRMPGRIAGCAAAAAGAVLWFRAPLLPLRLGVLPRALFLAVACIAVVAAVRVLRGARRDTAYVALASAAAALVSVRSAGDSNMAGGLLPYTIPMVIAAAALVQAAGDFVSRRSGGAFRSLPAAILLSSALICLIADRTSGREFVWSGGLSAVNSGRGSILIPSNAAGPFQQALDSLAQATQRGESVWIMPENMTLTYLSGAGFPYRHYQLLPGWPAPGKWTGRLLDEVNSHPAEWVLVCTRRFDEYGVRWFGISFHQQILEFVERRYEPVSEFGRFSLEPEPDQWGARLYRLRKAPAAGQPEAGRSEGIK